MLVLIDSQRYVNSNRGLTTQLMKLTLTGTQQPNTRQQHLVSNQSAPRNYVLTLTRDEELVTLQRSGSCLGRRLSQLGERPSHVPRLCSGPGFDSRPGSLCCVSLLLSHSLFIVISSAVLSVKPYKSKK